MSQLKKYYYLKLKTNFFDTDEMLILESMPDGYLYSNILLKLYLRSLKYNGKLMFNEKIPFNSQMLSTITRHSVGTVEKAMRIFSDLNLIEILESGAIYMAEIQNFIGESSTEADRKRAYRAQIAKEVGVKTGHLSAICPDNPPPEKEIEIELELEREKKKEKKTAEISKPKSQNRRADVIGAMINNIALENLELAETLADFVKMRKEIKKPVTERALKSIINRLENQCGLAKIAMLEKSITNCWADIYELKPDEKKALAAKIPRENKENTSGLRVDADF